MSYTTTLLKTQLFWRYIDALIGLLLTLSLTILILIPIHRAFTDHIPLPHVSPDGSFSFDIPERANLKVNQDLTLYRFHEGFRVELGSIKIEKITNGTAFCRLNRESLIFPVGRQGYIASQNGPNLTVYLGPDHTFNFNDRLNIFKEGENIGSLQLTNTARPIAEARIISLKRNVIDEHVDFSRLPVSEYTVATLIVVNNHGIWLVLFETLIFAGIIILELWIYRRFKIGTIAYVGQICISHWCRMPPNLRKFGSAIATLLFSVPFSIFGGLFLYYFLQKFTPIMKISSARELLYYGLILSIGFLYFFILIRFRRFPPIYIWEKMKYVPQRYLSKLFKSKRAVQFAIWFLHLFVAYAFAFALFGFLSSNINSMVEYLFPNELPLTLKHANLQNPWSILEWMTLTAHNFMLLTQHGIAKLSIDHFFALLRLFLWSITIVGCLLGYVHSVIKIGSLTSIKNVDFTILGWFTNAICYGPLLGSILWRIAPSAEGALPIITDGPVFYVMLVTEFLLNLLYTASIWNMFTKFGVMVDKGLVKSGFFGIIRHPNYTLESFMFLALSLRGISTLSNAFGVSFYFLIYWLRSEREDVFMNASNKDYAKYKEDVPYKYIRGLI